MRKFLITRGIPGSGKSSLARELGLEDYIISKDNLRNLYSSPAMNLEGNLTINSSFDKKVHNENINIIQDRMKEGTFCYIDGTFIDNKSMKPIIELANLYSYEGAILDFTNLSIDKALENNKKRSQIKIVPEESIKNFYEKTERVEFSIEMPRFFVPDCEIGSEEYMNFVNEIKNWLTLPVYDFNKYKEVIHIGDIHGCYEPLFSKGGIFENGVNTENAYVFVGDYVDRGLDNGKVLKKLIEMSEKFDNLYFLEGNHELHIRDYIKGISIKSSDFANNSLPQIQHEGLRKRDMKDFIKNLHTVLYYKKDGINVFVNHAGLSNFIEPENAFILSDRMYTKGPGDYGTEIDSIYSYNVKKSKEKWFQVHGHRNRFNVPILNSSFSFNLEDKIEFGGNLAVAILKNGTWESKKIANKRFKPLKFREGNIGSMIKMPWLKENSEKEMYLSDEEMNELRNHKLIKEKTSESYPHISSFNFTRDAFFNNEWDELNIKARGLFINNKTNKIIARGDEKFFNLGEREETSLKNVSQNFTFPAVAYVKENGFYALASYDEYTDTIFYTSKSTPDSPFAKRFKEILDEKLGNDYDAFKMFLRDNECSCMFEVNDPIEDPHMIKYNDPHIVLLNVHRLTINTEKADYEKIKEVADTFNFPYKKVALKFENGTQLNGWYKSFIRDEKPFVMGNGQKGFVEGVVIEGAKGEQVKIKFNFYAFWKKMRSIKDRVLRIRGTNRPLQRNLDDFKGAREFYEWCLKQPNHILEKSIIEVREHYEKSFGNEYETDKTDDYAPKI